MRFPEDDVEAWKMMASHIDYPKPMIEEEACSIDLFVRCWTLGDQYGIHFFQDKIMYALVCAEQDEVVRPSMLAWHFASAPPGSLLRSNLADYAVFLAEVKGAVKWKDLRKVIRENKDFGDAVTHALDTHTADTYTLNNMLFGKDDDAVPNPMWCRYMIINGPMEAHGWFTDPIYWYWREGKLEDHRERARNAILAERRSKNDHREVIDWLELDERAFPLTITIPPGGWPDEDWDEEFGEES